MKREQKAEAVKEIGDELAGADAVFAVDYRGISVTQAAELRAALREADASFTVVKNRLAKRATAEAGAEALDEHLSGPTALAYVRGDAVLAAKAIAGFIRANETISYKGGLMEGSVLDPDQFKAIARLPGVDVLRGQLVGLAASPLSGLVRTLNGLMGGLASQLGQIQEQGLIGGDAAAGEPAEEEATSAEEPAAEATDAKDGGGEDAAADETTSGGDTGGEETSHEPQQSDEETPEVEAEAEPEAGESKED